MKKQKKIFLSFVGTNDAGKLKNKDDGPILTALTNQKFDEVILLWNKSRSQPIDYLEIANYLKNEIKIRGLSRKTQIVELQIKNVIDHNHIYSILKQFTDGLDKNPLYDYTAAISSGTPAMQVCWILLAESGDFSETNQLKLIQVIDPKVGKTENVAVKIDTSLPRITGLQKKVNLLKNDLLPVASINITSPGLMIGEIEIPLTAIELCYYTYFAKRVIEGKGAEKFPLYHTTSDFLDNILQIHRDFFPDSDYSRQDLERIKMRNMGLDIRTFRGNISKLNKKIRQNVSNSSVVEEFIVDSFGVKGAKQYGIKAPKEKLKLIK